MPQDIEYTANVEGLALFTVLIVNGCWNYVYFSINKRALVRMLEQRH